MRDLDEIKDKVKELIISVSDMPMEGKTIEYDSDLAAQKVLSSISFVKLISSIEKEFEIEYGIEELSFESFQCIDKIGENIKEKMS